MAKVKLLLIAEIEVEDEDCAFESAQDRLDAFREASLPNEHGISLHRPDDTEVAEFVRDRTNHLLVAG